MHLFGPDNFDKQNITFSISNELYDKLRIIAAAEDAASVEEFVRGIILNYINDYDVNQIINKLLPTA